MNNFLIEVDRDFHEHFYDLLNDVKKEYIYNMIGEEKINRINNVIDILDLLESSLDEAIIEVLHYGLEVYVEIFKDEIGNSIPYHLLIGKNFSQQFYGMEILYNEGYYKTNIIIGNKYMNHEGADALLEKQVGTQSFNNIISLYNDLLLFDEYLGTYAAMANPFEELYSHKKIYLDINDKLIYINSTISPEMFHFK